MIHAVVEWWLDRPRWFRFGIAIFFLAISAVLHAEGVFWPYGWGMGGVLLLFALMQD